jgi:hypothetical protein
MPYAALNDPGFNRQITIRDSYKIMERFIAGYISRGDTPISDFLYSYAGSTSSGQTTDPAALDDYMAAAIAVLNEPQRSND